MPASGSIRLGWFSPNISAGAPITKHIVPQTKNELSAHSSEFPTYSSKLLVQSSKLPAQSMDLLALSTFFEINWTATLCVISPLDGHTVSNGLYRSVTSFCSVLTDVCDGLKDASGKYFWSFWWVWLCLFSLYPHQQTT